MSQTYSSDEIIAKAKEVADHIASTDQVRFYKQAEAKISANQKVQQLVEAIKQHQKESVNLQHFHKHEAYKENEAVINRLQEELDAIPVVQEFKQSQGEINDFLQLIVNLVSGRITDATDTTDTDHDGRHPVSH
jgi:Predicted membrane protein